MGQYYVIMNIDKKQYIYPHDLGNGAKLMEWSYIGNYMTNALMNMMAGDWKGDRVYAVGDYADTEDMEECWAPAYKAAIDELGIDENAGGDEPRTLHGATDRKDFQNVSSQVDIEERDWRYIVNRKTGQIIDLHHCPIEWSYYSEERDEAGVAKVHPLSLLLAMGNDRGGGDFRNGGHGYEFVGTWCDSSSEIEVYGPDDPINGAGWLKEFAPDFSENIEIIPWQKEAEVIEKVLKEKKGEQ